MGDYMIVDCHTHILPGIDDGPASTALSIDMINECSLHGVDEVWLTPHFDARRETITSFLHRRDFSVSKLLDKYTEKKVKLLCGSEVMLNYSLFDFDDLDKLCVNDRGCMLVEADCSYDISEYFKMLNTLISKYGITPIIAHIDRYRSIFGNVQNADEMIKMGCLLQINASAFLEPRKYFTALKRVASGSVSVIGSDCHNENDRVPNCHKAESVISKSIGFSYVNLFAQNAKKIAAGI